jgi:hypothetical protein
VGKPAPPDEKPVDKKAAGKPVTAAPMPAGGAEPAPTPA